MMGNEGERDEEKREWKQGNEISQESKRMEKRWGERQETALNHVKMRTIIITVI